MSKKESIKYWKGKRDHYQGEIYFNQELKEVAEANLRILEKK